MEFMDGKSLEFLGRELVVVIPDQVDDGWRL